MKNEKLIEHVSAVDTGRRFNIYNCLYDIEVKHERTVKIYHIMVSLKYAMPVTEL